MKIKRATYRHIEAEIYAYHETVKAIADLRRDIIFRGREEESVAISGGGYVSSIVERRATKLADSLLLREMERITGSIRDTFMVTKEEGRRIVWAKYGLAVAWEPPVEFQKEMQGKNRFDIGAGEMAKVLSIDESTFHRYRTGFVYGVAERLGWW